MSFKSFREFLKETVENWKDQIATNDETGKSYRVEDIYDYAKKHTKLIKNLPISETDALEWWDKQYDMSNKAHKKRMMDADTSVPVLGIRQEDGTISITDGLNRIKKAKTVEEKDTIPAYVIDKADMENIKPVEKKTLEEKWSQKYKKSIDCSHPKGFSQRAHCQGKKKRKK